MSRLRILQFGEKGQVASELLRLAGDDLSFVVASRPKVDLRDPAAIEEAVAAARDVDLVVNAAAYTAVDRAESEPDLAFALNADAPGAMAAACAVHGLPLIHISTDYVFDGKKDRRYCEEDATAPLNVYGASKLAGENQLRERLAQHVILRTSWVYAAHGSNFLRTMLRLGAERDVLNIVDDQVGAPTSAAMIAQAIITIARRIQSDRRPEQFGTFHFTAAGETNWFGFAEEIFRQCAPWAGLRARLVAIPAVQYPTPAARPENSRLDLEKIWQAYEIAPQEWREALFAVLQTIRREVESTP